MGYKAYDEYIYEGPVMEFEKCIANRWTARTFAPSEKKARCNLTYKFKMDTNKLPNTKITLPGKLVKVVGKDD